MPLTTIGKKAISMTMTSIELPDVAAIAGLRTAGTSVVGTNALARTDAGVLAIVGAGKQAAVHVAALAATRALERVVVFSRNPERRNAFAAEMASTTGLPVESAGAAEAAVRGADIVVTATNSSSPVLDGSWLEPGQHVTSIVGGMVVLHRERPRAPGRRELDDVTDDRADVIAMASREQAVLASRRSAPRTSSRPTTPLRRPIRTGPKRSNSPMC